MRALGHHAHVRLVALTTSLALLVTSAPSVGHGSTLPPSTTHGLAHRLEQYPTLALATPGELAAARKLLADLRELTRAWRDPKAAARRGFATKRPYRDLGERRVMWFHAEHRRWSNDGVHFDRRRPEVLIYADMPGRPLVLVGVMFAMPRGKRGPTPAGPIARWHWHRVCRKNDKRGLSPRADGSCPRGTVRRNGSEMMHVWFTDDLRSAFAIHAPVHELCVARKLAPEHCDHSTHSHG